MHHDQRKFSSGSGGGGETAVPEFPKVEIPASFKLTNPATDVPAALETIRLAAVDLEKRGQLTGDAFGKVVAELNLVKAAAMEAREAARNMLRSVPGPQDVAAPLKLRRIPLNLQVRGEADGAFATEFGKLDRSGKVGLVQYNLLTRTEDELGITDEGDRIQLKRLKALHDATTMMNLAHATDAAYFANGGHTSLWWYPEQVALAKKFMGALSDATAGEGLEWIQVNLLSSTVQELIELELEFSRIFQTFPMGAATVKWPVLGAHAEATFIGENVASTNTPTTNSNIVTASWTTTDKTYTARKFAAGVRLSTEWEEDAIINGPLFAQSEIARVLARGREKAIINGQRSSITGTSSTFDGGTIAATSVLQMYDGIRQMFKTSGKAAVDQGTGITAESLASMFGAQGAPGSKVRDCAWITGTSGLARLMVAKASDNSPLFLTLDKAGSQFALQTGALGMVFGRPVYTSEFVSEAMQADGSLDDVTTPTGNKTAIYHLYHRCMKIGQRRGVLISRSDDYQFLEEQIVFKGTAREDFQSNITPSSTVPLVMAGVNLATF